MFDLEQFIADCRAALAADSTHKLVREVVGRAVSDPNAVLKRIGEPQRAEVQKLYHSPDLTILNVIWGPMMTIMPHNHQMWAVIGIYSGREDKVFWRRLSDSPPHRRYSRLRWRLLRRRAERVGSGNLGRESLQSGKEHEVVRGFDRVNRTLREEREQGLERFPQRLNRDSLGGANMIQAAYWQEASMDGEAIFGGLA